MPRIYLQVPPLEFFFWACWYGQDKVSGLFNFADFRAASPSER
jgi:hypothetical protein